jgi:HD-GYP domain-containing protein (c-di-GMP phosphodiesterase class II)
VSTTAPPAVLKSETVLQPLGRRLVTGFYASSQSLRIYPLENATVQNAIKELHGVIRRIVDLEGRINLKLVGDFLFLNDARLRLGLTDYLSFSNFATLLRRHGVGEVGIEPGIEQQHVAAFVSLLLADGTGDEDAFARFVDRLQRSAALKISVDPAVEADAGPLDDEAAHQAAKRTYTQSVHVAREVLSDTRLGRAVNLRRVKRAVQTIVDQVLNNESSIVGMTALRDHDEYTFTHCVNVCIFSVVIGQKLGLTRSQLYELGIGALFHDIGKQRLAADIVNKAGALTDEEWQTMQEHPAEGLLAMFSLRGLADVPYRAMLMAYEHHMKTDLTGYPKNSRPREPTLFSHIVAAADGFDAGSSERSYQKLPWPPDEVLREMRDNPRRGFDPLLVKALINVTGVFPVGTLAILDTQELAVVVARNPDSRRLHQPVVRIISNPLGVMYADPPTADLAEVDAATGAPARSIIKTVKPEKYGIRVSDYV